MLLVLSYVIGVLLCVLIGILPACLAVRSVQRDHEREMQRLEEEHRERIQDMDLRGLEEEHRERVQDMALRALAKMDRIDALTDMHLKLCAIDIEDALRRRRERQDAF